MEKLRAKAIRKLAWDDLAAKQYWPFVGGHFVTSLIFGVAMVIGVVAVVLPCVIMMCLSGEASAKEMFAPERLLPIMAFSCVAIVPILYGYGFMGWGLSRLSLAAVNRELKFEQCLSGWGHGWKMCWTMLVMWTYAQLWLLLLVVPGIVKLYAYAMTSYVQVEHPDWTASQCITESRRLMDGNKWRFFCLRLSFFGWFLLLLVASLVPIVGNFAQYFFQPYFLTSTARFYYEVKREKSGLL